MIHLHKEMDIWNKETLRMFPLRFCETHWIEDLPVTNQVLFLWGSVRKTVKFWESLAKSWLKINNTMVNPLVPTRLHFLFSLPVFLKKIFSRLTIQWFLYWRLSILYKSLSLMMTKIYVKILMLAEPLKHI